jgi:lipopolysaccharide/colanic/teichoic acid biosynthesis glycosyltransferase
MIRIRGFARKTRRSTKGGSLSASPWAITTPAQLLNGVWQSISSMANNGHNNGNGAEAADLNSAADRLKTTTGRDANRARVGNSSNGNGVEEHLRRPIEGLIDGRDRLIASRAFGSDGEHLNGNGNGNGNGTSLLETVFARAAQPAFFAVERRHVAMPTWKRVLDVTCILLTIPVWLPLLLLVMAWIKLVSSGPIFYRQERVGYRRSRFMIFKFRTMHVNAETRSHEQYFAHLMRTDCPMTKLDAWDDTRLIHCGRLLRASGLDELPQIFNVLRGEMSLVGPRPCLPNEFENYKPSQQERVNAPPGLTGYWQVNGKNSTTFSEMIAMDMFYAEHMSVWLDLWIILRTIPALVGQTAEMRADSARDGELRPAIDSALNGAAKKI